MAPRSFTSHDTGPFDREAARERVEVLRSMLPPGTQIRLIEPSKGVDLTYLVRTVGDRARASALLAAVVDVVRTGDERWAVDLSVHATDDDTSPCTTFALPDDALPALDLLLAAHDDLYAALPTQTIGLDAADGTFTISDVPRDAALATARLAARWWESLLQRADGRWRDSSLSVAVGGQSGTDGVHAEISYDATIEREPDPMGYRRSDNGSRKVSDAVWTARVVAAWDENLPVLEAMLRLPVPPDHEVDLTLADDSLRPQLSVCHHETYEDDDVTAEALVAIIRSEVPGTRLTVG
ncbi:hypothetical protein H9657_10525 [Cellulomonas sp. Sa3CUA2]|uniref:Uncharacterized protein n=1 Tax=Cellulomonas avistercoris TaxID=2762242 RepID=A0ABR8QE51_9CELL|nr:hypothetical protein [Cellulomonas avistercoris]MBD7918708.1 hypothetical protein [Cellulomonas avistercoris]